MRRRRVAGVVARAGEQWRGSIVRSCVKKNAERNDRIISVEDGKHSYAHVRHVKELGKKFCSELEEFFVNYHVQQGKKCRLIDAKDPAEARRRFEEGMKKVGRNEG